MRLLLKLLTYQSKKKLTDSQSGFRAYSKDVLNKLNPTEMGMGVSTEILIKASNKKFRITEVPIIISYEGETSTHDPISHGTSVIISTIKYTAIQKPLTFYGIPSLVFLVIGGIFSFYSIEYYLEVGRLNTNITIIAVAMLLFSIVFMITAIILFSISSMIKNKD